MALSLFNTLSRTEEVFKPLDPNGKRVTVYCCGPTVYNYAHIGNFRTFIFQDLLRRHLEARGYDVLHVMNVTDVEDKIIRTVRETGETLPSLTGRFEKAFLDDLQTLGCLTPKIMPKATLHVAEMIQFIESLITKGFAYATPDGSVYFSIKQFPQYGKLARLDLTQLKPGARVQEDEHARESYGDFALWKGYVEADGEVFWESPWGRGRPGWHIECSCMSMKHLGQTMDIHCGGEDLIFPHHEDEIAQSEALSGKPFVRYWLHAAHLLVQGQKMSKSTGNFHTLRDLTAKGHSGRAIRLVLISGHYRMPLNFTFEGLEGARQSLARIDSWVERLRRLATPAIPSRTEGALLKRFMEALDKDLNVAEALAQLFEAIRESNKLMDENRLSKDQAADLLSDWHAMERVLGLPPPAEVHIPDDIRRMAADRQEARKSKDWKRSDELRDALSQRGWIVKDTPDGFKLTRA